MGWLSDADKLETIKGWTDLLLATFGVITALLALSSWGIGAKLSKLQAIQQRALQERVKAAENSAATLRTDLTKATEESLAAQESLKNDLGGAHAKVSSLEAAAAPRVLSQGQRTSIASTLRACAEGAKAIRFATPSGNREAESFARQLAEVFSEAGWEVSGLGRNFTMTAVSGLILRVHSVDSPHPCTGVVQHALKEAGYSTSAEVHADLPGDAVDLIVGVKP